MTWPEAFTHTLVAFGFFATVVLVVYFKNRNA